MNQNLFNLLLQPLEAAIASTSEIIDQDSMSQKLFFADFVRKLIFGYVYEVESLRNLSLQLKTNPICWELGLGATPFSTLKDGFSRFASRHFKQLLETVIGQTALKKVKWIEELGIFRVIDGSLFPTLLSMSWTNYRKASNAFKLHLSFDLNRMIGLQFWIGEGNSNERSFLETVLEAGLTYIADRGYFSFALAARIVQARAYFVMRGRDNLRYKVVEPLAVNQKGHSECLKKVTDQIVVFTNDEQQTRLRMISFEVAGSYFRLLTNRLDLTTLQVIILYAYRWQIELFFKFLKRTLKGLHLFNHSQNGVEIQFYVLMCVALLMLKLKQTCQAREKKAARKKEKIRCPKKKEEETRSPSKWIKNITQIFYESWKITRNWLTVVKNSLAQPADYSLLKLLSCL